MGFQCQKVGGPKDMMAPTFKSGGPCPPGPPASYATGNAGVKISRIYC